MLQKKHHIYAIYGLLFLSIYFVFFQHLDSFHLRNWDESMFAVNAYEMSNNNNYIVPFYKNLPDIWNSKPPLQLWFQVVFIKIIGYNELAIRMPSALASSASALVLFLFFKKRTSIVLALCVFFVFISSGGVATFHAGRTGDADALLSFFILCYCLSFYKYIFENNEKSILFFFIFLTLAFLTKSIAAFLFIPAVLIIVICFKKINNVFANKWFYMGISLFLSISIGYFFLRESQNNGYINSLINNDIKKFAFQIDSHKEPFDFYINNFFSYRFIYFLLVWPGLLLLLINQKHKEKTLFLVLFFMFYFLIISFSTTKLEWYDLPLFPFLSVFSAYTIYYIYSKTKYLQTTMNCTLFLCFTFSIPCYFAFRNAYKSEINPAEKKLEILTEYAFKNSKNNALKDIVFLTPDFDRALYFYKYKLNTKGMDFQITQSIDGIQNNTTVIVANDSLKLALTQKFDCQMVDSLQSAIKFNIKALK
ncbi:MAG: glycosyltransferase family 39 protein [Bacteroidia bacterium]|nr:glycosyltransferase family 39 protein [Bacteroidia bacterium]